MVSTLKQLTSVPKEQKLFWGPVWAQYTFFQPCFQKLRALFQLKNKTKIIVLNIKVLLTSHKNYAKLLYKLFSLLGFKNITKKSLGKKHYRYFLKCQERIDIRYILSHLTNSFSFCNINRDDNKTSNRCKTVL